MKYVAEYVSPGHPDRLCDEIVNRIVTFVVKKDKDALCGLECAVHTNKVFVDGRIAAGKRKPVITQEDIKTIVKEVYEDAGYGHGYNDWHPYPNELEIILDVCIETLSNDERAIRNYSDDQNIVNGFATKDKHINYLPVAHYVALVLGEIVNRKRAPWILGPDFKLLVELKKENSKYRWERLTLSMQHNDKDSFKVLYSRIKKSVDNYLTDLFACTSLDSLSSIEDEKFYLNGAGDFIQGGPEGDNGSSGKKLCVDFYGPQVPIGGGAIYGKDPHKIDVCGAFRARQLALDLVKKYGYYSVFTTLAWSPGEKAPYLIEAYEIDEFGTKLQIDPALLPPKDYFSIECINNDLKLGDREITKISDIK